MIVAGCPESAQRRVGQHLGELLWRAGRERVEVGLEFLVGQLAYRCGQRRLAVSQRQRDLKRVGIALKVIEYLSHDLGDHRLVPVQVEYLFNDLLDLIAGKLQAYGQLVAGLPVRAERRAGDVIEETI